MKKTIALNPENRVQFNNNAAYCVGTGRMGLALQQEYMDQLRLVQSECAFSHIRGHGLFCDDMGIYQYFKAREGNEHFRYNFTYLDRVFDAYRAACIKPFIELGFMPYALASGENYIFYWKGNTTPPADETKWTDLIKATLRHLVDRYGYEEVSAWPCEVWNEPNLPGFWQNADKEKYLRLYEISALAVKEAIPDMKVGGPAVCGGSETPKWITDFLDFVKEKKLPLDFVSRHAYMGETPEHHGRYLYHTMRTVEDLFSEMKGTRDAIDSYPEFKGMPMHITEFNTSYNPFCPIHDTNLNAAYISGLLAVLGDVAASYSYWTFGDVFEEGGVPATPFHGGFGLLANGMIKKPTYYTFRFFNNLKGEAIYRDENLLVTRLADGSFEGVAWNLCREERKQLELSLNLPVDADAVLLTETVDEECCNPLKVWHEMGEPSSLTKAQLSFLQAAAQPKCESRAIAAGSQEVALNLKENAVVHFTLAPVKKEADEGYDYEWYRTHS